MRCEWCTIREAVCAGVPHVGPLSRMCEACRDRLCKKDALGQFVTMSVEDSMKGEGHDKLQ
jgi:hypothetical protein